MKLLIASLLLFSSVSQAQPCTAKLGEADFLDSQWVSNQLAHKGYTLTSASDASITLGLFNRGYMTTTNGCYAFAFGAVAKSSDGHLIAEVEREATMMDEYRMKDLSERVAKRAMKALVQSLPVCNE